MKPETVSCANSGHLWGAFGRCVMCGEARSLPPPEPLKVCRDCKWCRYPERPEAPCFHDVASLPFVDWVTGLVGPSPIFCRSMRGAHFPCGVEARLFEAREATTP